MVHVTTSHSTLLTIFIYITLHYIILITSLLHNLLTPEVVSYEEHCALSDDAAHWVRVLDIAHEQLMFVEHPRGRMGHLVRPHKPGAMEPRVITDREGEEGDKCVGGRCVCVCVRGWRGREEGDGRAYLASLHILLILAMKGRSWSDLTYTKSPAMGRDHNTIT